MQHIYIDCPTVQKQNTINTRMSLYIESSVERTYFLFKFWFWAEGPSHISYVLWTSYTMLPREMIIKTLIFRILVSLYLTNIDQINIFVSVWKIITRTLSLTTISSVGNTISLMHCFSVKKWATCDVLSNIYKFRLVTMLCFSEAFFCAYCYAKLFDRMK